MTSAPSLSKQTSTASANNGGNKEANVLYEEALMSSMLTKMNSLMAQKMMNIVEQERALMIEQHQNVLEGASSGSMVGGEEGTSSDAGQAMDETDIVVDSATGEVSKKLKKAPEASPAKPHHHEDVKASIINNESKSE